MLGVGLDKAHNGLVVYSVALKAVKNQMRSAVGEKVA